MICFLKRMPAELSFEQLENKTSETEIEDIFHQAFISVENAYLETIDHKIAERTQLLEKVPVNMTPSEATEMFPETFDKLKVYGDQLHKQKY